MSRTLSAAARAFGALVLGLLFLAPESPSRAEGAIAGDGALKELEHYARKTWRMQEGLPQETVRALARTSDGHLWIGTRAGLARFDGRHFEVYDRANTPILESALIVDLLVDRNDRLWIGTLGGGLYRYSEGRFERIDRGADWPDPRISALAESRTGTIFVGTLGGLVILREDEAPTVVGVDDGLPNPFVSALAFAGDHLWIGTHGSGLAAWSEGRIRFLVSTAGGLPSNRIWDLEPAIPVGLPDNESAGIRFDGKGPGVLYVGTDSGLALVDAEGRTRRVFGRDEGLRSDRVLSLARARGGELYIGTDGGGLHRSSLLAAGDARLDRWPDDRAESRHAIWALHVGLDGDLWYGTGSDGLHLLRDGAFVTRGTADGLRSNIVTAVIPSRHGGLWLATRDAGVHRIDDSGRVVEVHDRQRGLGALGAWSMVEDDQGLWVGTDGDGLYRIEAGRVVRDARSDGLDGRIFVVEPDRRGGLWLGTNGGLAHLPSERATASGTRSRRVFRSEDGLPGNQVRSLELDEKGRLFIGTVDGLAMLRGDTLEALTPPEGLLFDNVYALYEDRQGVLWAGSEGMGLARIDGADFEVLDTSRGLFSDQIVSLLEDRRGDLWIGSSQGLGRIDARDLERFADDRSAEPPQEVYGRLDGLGGGGIWGSGQGAALLDDGRLVFATREGLAELDPETVVRPVPPNARIERIEIRTADGPPREIPIAGTRNEVLELPADARRIRLRFSAADPSRGGPRDLRYRLAGFDRDWIHGPDRIEKTYDHLPEGHYVFEVQASDAAGRFGTEVAVLPIRIRPPFTDSSAFYLLLAVGTGLALFGLHRRRIHRLERERVELDHRVREAIAELNVARGLLRICGSCRKVRNDEGYWQQVEVFLHDHSEAIFSHGLCPTCMDEYLEDIEA